MKIDINLIPTFVLGLVFVVLKLCHVIDWSWWWVTIAFWLIPVILLSAGAACLLFAFARKLVRRCQ